MDRDRYLERIGVDPATVSGVTSQPDGSAGREGRDAADRETLARLQRAHVTSVPFETFAINGDPYDDGDNGAGVSLGVPDLYEKIVERERGGFCFELNGLFGWLLADLGFDADRVAARVVNDGDSRPPANHHSHVVHLDRDWVVDVGMGIPTMRRPLPLHGEVVEDETGVAWRVVASDRLNADYSVEYREPGSEWDERYFFRTTPRRLSYFAATCEYLATDPESGFVGDPVATIATEGGHLKLTPERLTRSAGGETEERQVTPGEYHDLLEREFGLSY